MIETRGINELARVFRRMGQKLPVEMRDGLQKAADSVASAVTPKAAQFYAPGAAARGYVRGGRQAVVTTTARRKGVGSNFGSVLYRHAYSRGLEEKSGEVVHIIDESVDHVTSEF